MPKLDFNKFNYSKTNNIKKEVTVLESKVQAAIYIDKKAILDALYVSKNHRKKGIANLLINNFKEWCIKQKIDNLELTVCSENVDACKTLFISENKNII